MEVFIGTFTIVVCTVIAVCVLFSDSKKNEVVERDEPCPEFSLRKFGLLSLSMKMHKF